MSLADLKTNQVAFKIKGQGESQAPWVITRRQKSEPEASQILIIGSVPMMINVTNQDDAFLILVVVICNTLKLPKLITPLEAVKDWTYFTIWLSIRNL